MVSADTRLTRQSLFYETRNALGQMRHFSKKKATLLLHNYNNNERSKYTCKKKKKQYDNN